MTAVDSLNEHVCPIDLISLFDSIQKLRLFSLSLTHIRTYIHTFIHPRPTLLTSFLAHFLPCSLLFRSRWDDRILLSFDYDCGSEWMRENYSDWVSEVCVHGVMKRSEWLIHWLIHFFTHLIFLFICLLILQTCLFLLFELSVNLWAIFHLFAFSFSLKTFII